MLIPLFLWQQESIARPVFYISAYFEKNRDSYYKNLRNVSANNAWTQWFLFFLQAIKTQAEDNIAKAKKILALYNEMKTTIPNITNSQHAIKVLDWIFHTPVFQTTQFIEQTQILPSTARRILTSLNQHGILKTLYPASGRQSATYSFPNILNIAEGKEIF